MLLVKLIGKGGISSRERKRVMESGGTNYILSSGVKCACQSIREV